jgi:protein-S-isoprenylcysteine O-methyltransferase Ste14
MDHRPLLASPRTHVLGSIALAALWLLFATSHLIGFSSTGRPGLLLFAIAETLIALFFIFRTPPRSFASGPVEWMVAVAGTFLPLLLRPTAETPPAFAEWGLMLGSALQIAGVLSLNRSFAIVPALRELKTGGMYAIVRHPIYLSYVISSSCYLVANFSLANLVIVAATLGLLLVRVHFEERHLSQTPEYRAYRGRVRWRLLPFVY